MERRTKRIKKRIRRCSIDRLSYLPDSILCHILSFLPTKFAAATTILSPRWRFLWTQIPNLDFDSSYHHTTGQCAQLIDAVTSGHTVKPLNSFRLFLEDAFDFTGYQIEPWIASAVACGVKSVYLSLSFQFPPPNCLFACETLVELSLHFSEEWTHTPVHLPALKKLRLDQFTYQSDESLPLLLSGCPVLEELIIDRIALDNMFCCSVSSPTLKRLTLESYSGLPLTYDRHRMVINAPVLEYLRLVEYDDTYKHMLVGEMPSLIEAEVEFHNWRDKGDDHDLLYCRMVLDIVARLCNAKNLKLLMSCVKFYGSAFSSWNTRFCNLTKLELRGDWCCISMFLENADNLEVLIFWVNKNLTRWKDPQKVPTCLSSRLRTVKIDYFGCAEFEFEMVRYLLKNAKVLKRMEIQTQWLPEKTLKKMTAKYEAIRRVAFFERGSDACVLAFD